MTDALPDLPPALDPAALALPPTEPIDLTELLALASSESPPRR